MAVTDDDSFLITGGEDSLINVWKLDECLSSDDVVKPFHSFSQHSLAITGLYVSYGGFNSIIGSTSLDRTCKVPFFQVEKLDLAYPFKEALVEYYFPHKCIVCHDGCYR